jgi:ectoine hydrolase
VEDIGVSAFEAGEYQQRISKTKARMAERDLDLLFVTTPENINYLCGYAAWSFYTSQALLLTREPAEPVLVLRDMDVACARFTAFLSADSLVGYPEDYIGGDKHPMSFIARTIDERCGNVRRVGIEPGGFFFPPAAHRELARALPQADLIDAQGLVNWLRTVKSDNEIAVMRQAAAIASRGIQTAREQLRPGIRECDVAAEIYRTLIRGEESFGGSMPASFALVSGSRTTAPHISWTDDRLQEGRAINLELGGSRHHYHAGLSRSFFLGRPPQPMVRLAETVIEGFNSALEAVKPGRQCEEVESAWRAVLKRSGYEKKSRIGYSIGLGFQPTWIDYTASLQPGDRTVLEPNMTFHMICGMWKGEHNFILSETFRVTDSGCEVMTQAPRELLVRD